MPNNWNDYNAGFNEGLMKACEIAKDLEDRWRRSAARIRKDGTWTTGWPFYKVRVALKWEAAAKDMEAAANGIKAIRDIVLRHRKPVGYPDDESV